MTLQTAKKTKQVLRVEIVANRISNVLVKEVLLSTDKKVLKRPKVKKQPSVTKKVLNLSNRRPVPRSERKSNPKAAVE